MPSDSHPDQRRERAAAAEGLGDWYLAELSDGEDEAGNLISWYEYKHLDGRTATVSECGRSTDPELQILLDEKHHAAVAAQAELPWWASAMGVIRWLAK
ncbi:MAG: hypothetical protein EBZ24_15170, partial [Synechococcaceae bacterium WB9_4xB_025]|nr:hypothetical protein [Synechococcaceae bacterium WB9_4xB_025]